MKKFHYRFFKNRFLEQSFSLYSFGIYEFESFWVISQNVTLLQILVTFAGFSLEDRFLIIVSVTFWSHIFFLNRKFYRRMKILRFFRIENEALFFFFAANWSFQRLIDATSISLREQLTLKTWLLIYVQVFRCKERKKINLLREDLVSLNESINQNRISVFNF